MTLASKPFRSLDPEAPLRIVGAYLCVAFGLVFVVNRVVPRFAAALTLRPGWDIASDVGLVLGSAAILYHFLRKTARRIARSEETLERATRRQRSTDSLLHVLNLRILRGEPVSESLVAVCAGLVEAFGYDLAWIGRKEPGGEMTVRALAGPARGFLEGVSLRWDGGPEALGPAGMAVRTGRPQAVVIDHPECSPLREQALRFGIRSSVALPLIVDGETMGTLSVCSTTLERFEEDDVGRLQAFADEIAISVDAALRQEKLGLQNAALEAASNSIVITDRDGVIRWVNPAFTALTGYSAAESIGQTPRLLKSGAHGDAFYRALWEKVASGQTWRGELYNRRKDGSVYIEEQTVTPVRGAAGEITHYIAIKQDVTTRRQQEAELRHLLEHDPVTDLPNRHALLERLERAVLRCRYGASGAFLVVDIDDFKVVNDTVGPVAADSVLMNVASHLAAAIRPGDFLAHLGHDEFAIVIEKTPFEEARELGERIRDRISEARFTIAGHDLDIGVSGGLALLDGSLDAEGVLALANSALFAAKDSGHQKVVSHRRPEERLHHVSEAGRWASRVKDALASGLFELNFQPVVPLQPGRKVHYEVLLRMVDGDGALIHPGSFLPAAERFGLMPRIDEWVVSRALDCLDSRPDVELFVNLSGKSLGDEGLFSRLESRIRSAGETAERLTFEITETTAISDLMSTQRWIRRLKELGCSFALDDFGIGFSSLSYLRALAVDYVKIDGSFMRGLDTDLTNRALVQAVKNVAHILGKEVIAECVESEAVAAILADMEIEYGQGFYWGAAGSDIPRDLDSSSVAVA